MCGSRIWQELGWKPFSALRDELASAEADEEATAPLRREALELTVSSRFSSPASLSLGSDADSTVSRV
jgi:hypothetical protein